jgi:hypothetical protein
LQFKRFIFGPRMFISLFLIIKVITFFKIFARLLDK